MSSLLLSPDSHLMMLEVAVENLFVPWTTAFDKTISKKTVVMFRMLDNDWISLSPNRCDYLPYQGSNCENEKFYGGGSVVFSVPIDFLEKKARGIDVQLYVRKDVLCKYFETVSRERIGSAAVPVDNLLNSIAKQIRERNELAEHLSDFYKRQIISRSMMGTYTLLDENFRSTAATISLYIRISYLGKCLVTEITQVKSTRGAFYVRGDSDERQPYLSRQLTSKELQSGRWVDSGLLHVPHGRLICRCEELVKKEAVDLAKVAVDTTAIKRGKAPARKIADSAAAISIPKVIADADVIEKRKAIPADTVADSAAVISLPEVVPDTVAIKRERELADVVVNSATIPIAAADTTVAIERGKVPANAVANSAAIPVAEVTEDVVAVKEINGTAIHPTAISVTKIAGNASIIENTSKAPGDTGTLGDRADAGEDVNALANAHERTAIPIMATDNEVINDERARKDLIDSLIEDIEVNAAVVAKTKGYAIKDNGERAFRKAFYASSKSRRGRNTTTIGITERRKRIRPSLSPPLSLLQTYPLCCQLQPHLTCFTDCFDVSLCYCYWTACPLRFFYSA